jgi:hypothetical protein
MTIILTGIGFVLGKAGTGGSALEAAEGASMATAAAKASTAFFPDPPPINATRPPKFTLWCE